MDQNTLDFYHTLAIRRTDFSQWKISGSYRSCVTKKGGDRERGKALLPPGDFFSSCFCSWNFPWKVLWSLSAITKETRGLFLSVQEAKCRLEQCVAPRACTHETHVCERAYLHAECIVAQWRAVSLLNIFKEKCSFLLTRKWKRILA